MNEKIKEEVKKLYDEGQKLLDDYIDDKEEKIDPNCVNDIKVGILRH